MVPLRLWIPKISCTLAIIFAYVVVKITFFVFRKTSCCTQTQMEKGEGCHFLLLLLAHSLLV